MEELRKYCNSGGCSAKLGPAFLSKVLNMLPKQDDSNLLVGFDSSDDAAVYRVNDEIALVTTLDFFTPIVEDPYLFGKIAAANSLSDVYAMGGKPLTALNIVCFPESLDANILGEILRGGQEKVTEAGAILCGGHSIKDDGIKYGLSVTGIVHPSKVKKNNSAKPGDVIILTKPIGTGIVTSAHKIGAAPKEAYAAACDNMQTLNRYAAEIADKYETSARTDVTGFGFLGHLNEMVASSYSIHVNSGAVPALPFALTLAEEFYITASGQRNRAFVGEKCEFAAGVGLPVQELLFDPQTSGGLLIAAAPDVAAEIQAELRQNGICAEIVAYVVNRNDKNIIIE